MTKSWLLLPIAMVLSGCHSLGSPLANQSMSALDSSAVYSAPIVGVGRWEFNAPERKIVLMGLYSDTRILPSGRAYELVPSHEMNGDTILLSMSAHPMSEFGLALDAPIQRYEVAAPAGVYSVVDKTTNRTLGVLDTQAQEGIFR